MKLYKLTDKDGYTRRSMYNECLWGPKVTHSGTGKGDLCSPGYVHAYTSPYLAVLLNSIHANLQKPRLWSAEGDVMKSDNGLKVGCLFLTTLEELSLPEFSLNQKTYFALLCASEVYKDSGFIEFVHGWITGKDRTDRAAWAAEAAARAAAEAAARAARAARAAARAARAAARAAWTAEAAAEAARAAARAAWAAWANLDLICLAEKAYLWKDPMP